MNCELRLHLDRHAAKSEPVALGASLARALYVVDGSLALRSGDRGPGTDATIGANSAIAMQGPARVSGGSLPATVLRWELVAAGADTSVAGAVETRVVLAAPMSLDAPDGYLLRCDRVDFPPGGEALTHTHQGGGIRCLLFGSIRIDTDGTSHRYGPLGAWSEAGPDAVYAAADREVASAFARVMILPRALLGGQSSICYVNAEDQAKPKSQRYQIFIDQPIEWPR